MRLLAPAKINLHLRVGKVRADGFHPLVTWMSTVGLFDTLTLELVPADEGAAHIEALASAPVHSRRRDTPLALTCDLPSLGVDESNLVVKAGSAFLNALAEDGSPLQFARGHLEKRIPMGAGLGGGSSDGAITLIGLNSLCHAGRSAEFLSDFAARFGSDLSFFCFGPSSICRGRGESVAPIASPAPKAVLLLLPEIHMPTPDVYRKFDAMGLGESIDNVGFDGWPALNAVQVLPRLENDLEAPAFAIAPELGALRERAERTLSRPVRMSGSGSSLFTLYDTIEEAMHYEPRLNAELKVRALVAPLAPAHLNARS